MAGLTHKVWFLANGLKWFNNWSKSGILDQVLAMLIEKAEDDYIAMDSTSVKVHKHGSAPAGDQKKRVYRKK